MTRWINPPGPRMTRDADGFREIVETVVFVVVLVLLLKTFAAEAFVIPTGSMATTLWGYQKYAECPQCGYHFPVNCSKQAESTESQPAVPVIGCTCPNCRYQFEFKSINDPSCNTGDRVLVAKSLYDLFLEPERLQVVVFKYPKMPQDKYTPTNYIKRLIGLPGETIGIYYGKLYVVKPGQGPAYNDGQMPWERIAQLEKEKHPADADQLTAEFVHRDKLADQLKQGQLFEIIRKPPAQILALRRIVYDNDHPAKDLVDVQFPPRWAGEGWAADEPHGFKHGAAGGLDWLRYRHIIWEATSRDTKPDAELAKPELITDFMGYNALQLENMPHPILPPNWVGDLMLECELTVGQPGGEVVLELSKGQDRFRAHWDLSSGACTLLRLGDDRKEEKLAEKPTALGKPGTHHVRFANVDERLVVWVDNALPFGDGVTYDPPKQRGPFANDLEPAGIGARGASVSVHKLQLWRDTYYTIKPGAADASLETGTELHKVLSSPDEWAKLRDLPASTLYVQPDHLLCLGDNSPESYDGRSWGLVPRRLLLGRALLVYFPFKFPYWPLYAPVNRVGTIR